MDMSKKLWCFPPANITLSSTDVHVWRSTLEQAAPRVQCLAESLSRDERLRADRYYFERDRKHFIVGRGVLRTIISCYLGIEPGQVQFSYGPRGKPYLHDICGDTTLRFNIAHSNGIALYAFTRDREIGVDIEYMRPMQDAEQIVSRYFSTIEAAAMQMLPNSQRQEAFFNCWTRKEAYIKATGDGLAHPLDQCTVSFSPGKPARLLYAEGDPGEASRWSLMALAPVPGYVAALAVAGGGWRLRHWQFT